MMLILYQKPDDTIGIIEPARGMDALDVALRCVPEGAPFLLLDAAELPADPAYRDAWEADFSEPDGVGVGPENYWLGKSRGK